MRSPPPPAYIAMDNQQSAQKQEDNQDRMESLMRVLCLDKDNSSIDHAFGDTFDT